MFNRKKLTISAPRQAGGAGASRVTADVCGHEVWFESEDVELRAAPEAFGSAFLIPGLALGRRMAIEGEVDAAWLANVENIVRTARKWWRFPALMPEARPAMHPGPADGPEPGSAGAAFSGGVDSFYTLLCPDRPISRLVFVHGYDMRLEDRTRFLDFRRTIDEVCASLGIRPVIIRTNLRDHPLFCAVSWNWTHGGALAAIGHLLSGYLSQFIISSSIWYEIDKPWGSHWMIDRYWSSSRLEVINYGADTPRYTKLLRIAANPLVRNHLRVCWENLTATGNCSKCEKCVATRLILHDAGLLDSFPVFEGGAGLVEEVGALNRLDGTFSHYRKTMNSENFSEELRRAIRAKVEREFELERREASRLYAALAKARSLLRRMVR